MSAAASPKPCAEPYDALLLVSFGGPEAPADVLPFLANVTAGREIPPQRLREVAAHYDAFAGRSPINDQNRALLAALRDELDAHGLDVPLYWGNRNWHPYLREALSRMRADGVRRAAVFVTSAYSSYSGCRQYREDLAAAEAAGGTAAGAAGGTAGGNGIPRLDKLRHYYNHPGFLQANTEAVLAALDRLPAGREEPARLVYVTHSIPVAMDASSGPGGGAYTAQHRAAAAAISRRVDAVTGHRHDWDLVFCSRSGPLQVPWLEPDVNDHLDALSAAGVPAAVLVPVGFVSDHLEVRYDLDTEAAATAARRGLPCTRAATAGTHPAFVSLIRELLLERAAAERGEHVGRPAAGPLAPWPDVCPAGCCSNPRGWRPAVAGLD